jgi:hypothetical protein
VVVERRKEDAAAQIRLGHTRLLNGKASGVIVDHRPRPPQAIFPAGRHAHHLFRLFWVVDYQADQVAARPLNRSCQRRLQSITAILAAILAVGATLAVARKAASERTPHRGRLIQRDIFGVDRLSRLGIG